MGLPQKYVVINRSDCNIELIIPAPAGSNRSDACFIVASTNSIDILPWCGTLENCRRIAQLHDLKYRGLIEIVEEA